jgi:flagellar biosynthetic protein FliO
MAHTLVSLLMIGVAPGADPRPEGPDLTRYLLVCGGLIAAILALAWGFRRLLKHSGGRALDRRGMRIVDMLPLGGKQRIAVVRCYDRTFVLGLGDKEVNLVGELDRETVPQQSATFQGRPDFSRMLANLMGRPQPEGTQPGTESTAESSFPHGGRHA